MTPEKAVGEVAMIAAAGLVTLGAYGAATSSNTLRTLLSIEVMFNGVILALASLLSFAPTLATAILVVLISVVSAEVIVVVALLAGFYRVARTFDSKALEEEGV